MISSSPESQPANSLQWPIWISRAASGAATGGILAWGPASKVLLGTQSHPHFPRGISILVLVLLAVGSPVVGLIAVAVLSSLAVAAVSPAIGFWLFVCMGVVGFTSQIALRKTERRTFATVTLSILVGAIAGIPIAFLPLLLLTRGREKRPMPWVVPLLGAECAVLSSIFSLGNETANPIYGSTFAFLRQFLSSPSGGRALLSAGELIGRSLLDSSSITLLACVVLSFVVGQIFGARVGRSLSARADLPAPVDLLAQLFLTSVLLFVSATACVAWFSGSLIPARDLSVLWPLPAFAAVRLSKSTRGAVKARVAT